MRTWESISLSDHFVKEIDSRRGHIKRASYIQVLIRKAWKQGLQVEGEIAQKTAQEA